MKWLHNPSAHLAANKSALHVGMKMIGCAGNLDKKGEVGKVLSNITNLPLRTIPSKVALSSSHSSSTHQSFEPNESASINHCKSTKANKFVTIPEEEEEDSRDDNKHYKSSTNNHQLILNNNTSIFEAYDECPWLSDYRAIKIHSTMTPLEAYPHYQLQSIIPKFGQNLLCDYIKIAKEYKRMGKYRVRSNESKAADKLHCVNCYKKNAQLEKAFFPCEHKCVCRDCFEERRFEVCPLCKTEVKFTGNDHKEYQDWLDEVRAEY